jgi:two-component system phosphate regulon sensor histidine kinase PhoR
MPRIQRRLMLALALLVVGVSGLSGFWVDRAVRAREQAQMEARLESSARATAELVRSEPFDLAHAAELSELARRASQAVGARVTLIAPDGGVVADSDVRADALASVANHADRPEVAAALAGRVGADTRRSDTVGRPYLYLAVPRATPSPPGVVRLAADRSAIDEAVSGMRSALLAGGVIALIAALVLSWFFSRALLRPLWAFHAALARLSAGDLGARVRWRSNDELGDLARSLDRMAEDLERSQEAIIGDRDRLAAVLRVMVEGVLVVDAEERIVLANPRLRELLGIRGEIEGLRPLAAFRNADVDAALREALAASESVPVHREITLSGPERRVMAVHAASFAIGDSKGAVAVFHDMTEVRRLETVRRDFVANASHEIKTPLTAIRGFAETLLSNDLAERDARNYLEIILRHSERLSRLVEDLLELSRLESGKVTLQPEPLDVGALATKLCRELEPRLRERRVSVRIHAEGAPLAFADARAVEQILQNLLDNALKYSDPERAIEVRVAADEDFVRVDVADQGIGIPEADRARIFERFYRVDRARTRDQGGTGLGLSIVKHLVQASGGDVWVESSPGAGSTFAFTLPSNFTRP